ncbi:MAG: SPOR domain-containing protein [Motiliproteus sp.]|nr:SPOR domain-containing protein [Motiliproteus sp.]MCW9051139.1 SPOR domain-containing protein [Motiliproteus sp.]
MSQKRKQRLLGFLLLLSLAVIFLPMVLDGSGYRERQSQVEITIPPAEPAPEMQVFSPQNQPFDEPEALPEPRQQPPEIADQKTDKAPVKERQLKELATKPKLSVKKEKPVLDTQGIPVAWTIQLASFKDGTNARQLKKKLIAKGYKAYLRRKGELNKVFVGPDIQRTEVEKLRVQLKKEFKLDGLILRFTTS